jgi:hypothetical protein
MINSLIYLLIVYVVIGVIWWVADYLPIPEPLNKILKVLSIVVALIITIYVLLGMAGVAIPR